MKNITLKHDEAQNKLIIEVDLNKNLGPSKSGKTIMVATTEGNTPFHDVVIGLNIYKYRD